MIAGLRKTIYYYVETLFVIAEGSNRAAIIAAATVVRIGRVIYAGRISVSRALPGPSAGIEVIYRIATNIGIPIPAARIARSSASHIRVRAVKPCLLYTSPSPRDRQKSRMP